MKARKLLDPAPYGADTVRVLKQALDEAWASMAPDLIADIRLSLAHAIIAHASLGDIDREALKVAALEAVQKHPPQVLPAEAGYRRPISRWPVLNSNEPVHVNPGAVGDHLVGGR